MKKYSVAALAIGLLVLAGCGQSSDALELSETHVIMDFGFSIDYPEGWIAETRETVTAISEVQADHVRAASGVPFDAIGYGVVLDHRDLSFMLGIGLPEGATLDDLLEFNTNQFDWQVLDVSETEIFGVPALQAKKVNEFGNVGISYQGFIGDEIFLFGFTSPSEDAFDEFDSTWEAMLDSIQPVEE